jgi:hypothetical protein
MVNKEMTKRWVELKQQICALTEEMETLEKKLGDDFIKSHTATFTLPKDVDLIWRSPSVLFKIDRHNQPVIEMSGMPPEAQVLRERLGHRVPGHYRRHTKGTKFIVLKAWKTGKTKGTHYLLYDKKTKRVANFYG